MTGKIAKPIEWPDMNSYQRGAWYDTHKDEMMADFQSMRFRDFSKRWDIAKATWNGVYKRFLEGRTSRKRQKEERLTRPQLKHKTKDVENESRQRDRRAEVERRKTGDYWAGYRQAILDTHRGAT